MKTLEVYIIRHGETDWNVKKRLQGHTDIPLNATGKKQALQLGEKLKSIKLNKLISSDLERAVATAEAVNQHHGVILVKDPGLRECFLGDVEGMHKDELVRIYGSEVWQRWLSGKDRSFSFPGGESISEHEARLLQVIEREGDINPSGSILGISTHGGSIKRIVSTCVNIGDNPILIPNCSTYRLRYSPSTKVLEFIEALFI